MNLPDTATRTDGRQRARGAARLTLRTSRAATRLHRLYQQGSARVRFPATSGTEREAVLINTAGGLAGGDRLDWRIEVGDDAHCVALSQACEKTYRSDGEAARIDVSLAVGRNARLDWLPQETILFESARLERRFEADVSGDGRLLAVEAVILGRRAMGETARGARLTDHWRVRRDGRLIFADAFRLNAWEADGPARLAGAGAFALVLLVGPDAGANLDAVRASLNRTDACAHAGASTFGSKLVCRILARDGVGLRRALLPVMALLRDGAPPPRLWMV